MIQSNLELTCETNRLKIYDEFETGLVKCWKELYNKGANYNLSYEWCYVWAKYFIKKNRRLYIITLWKNETLKLLAPFYISDNRLFLIGTEPDLYDEFNVLYEEDKYIDELLKYIEDNRLEATFNYLNTQSVFAKNFMRQTFQKNLYIRDNLQTRHY